MAGSPQEKDLLAEVQVPYSRVYYEVHSRALYSFALDLLFITQVHNIFPSKKGKEEE